MNQMFTISLFAFCFLSTFLICWSRLYLNLGPLFIYRLMVTPTWYLNIIFFIFFYTIFYLLIHDDIIFILNNTDKCNNISVGENAVVNIGQLSLPINHMNKTTAAAMSAAGGASAGIQVAKQITGPPIVKLAAGVTTAAAVQLTTTFMAKLLNNDQKNISKLALNISSCLDNQNMLNNYPLNLLFEINGLLVCSLTFLYIITNIYISKYIISKDWIKYIPKDYKISKFLIFYLNKYLNMWNKSSNYLLGFCHIMLLLCIIFCKFGLYLIFI